MTTAKSKKPAPVLCCICEDPDAPAPHVHPLDAKLRLCQPCRENMQFAEDLAERRGHRIGDAGERAKIMGGRQVPGGGR